MRRLVFFSSIFITLGLATGTTVYAQIDGSSALLLNNDTSDVSGTALDSGRYTIRPKDSTAPARPVTSRKQQTSKSDSDPAPVTVAIPAQPTPPPATAELVQPTAPAASTNDPRNASRSESRSETRTVPAPAPPPQAFVGSRRNHILDFSISPGYLYNASDSIYSFRNYSLAAPVVAADADVWVSPTFGLHGAYMTTYNASVSDSNSGTKDVSLSETWLSLGVKMREFLGSDAMAPSLAFGVDYVNFTMQVSSDARTRESLISSGVQLSFAADVPVSPRRAWTLDLTFAPLLSHSEGSTGITFQSGSSVSAASLGASLGNRYQLSRSDAIFWKFSELIEKDIFSGTASVVDPVTGSAPTDVSVTNSFSILQIGYTWGG